MSDFVNDLYDKLNARRLSGYKYYSWLYPEMTRRYYYVPVLTKDDLTEIETLANYFGFKPVWLANLINLESGGTFNPSIQNSIGATGLIQFMPSCLSIDTEILTINGWKNFYDVNIGDKILSFNEKTDKIEIDSILDLFYYKSNDCYRINNKQFDFIATDNHRWYCDYNGKIKIKTTEELRKQSSLFKFIRAKKFDFKKTKINRDLFFELIGIIIGDGSIERNGRCISIYQSIKTKPKIVERINYITNSLYGITYRYQEQSGDMVRWNITGDKSQNISNYFINNNIIKINQKVINKEKLLDLSESEVRALKKGLMETDGTMQYNKYQQYTQCHWQRVSDFQIICLMLGELGNIKSNKRKHTEQLFPNGNTYPISPYKYNINIQQSPLTEARKIRMNYEKINESVEVWCPQTKNKTWIARRNGYITITGNTAPDFNTTVVLLRAMTFKNQMVYVKKYLYRGFISKKIITKDNVKVPETFTFLDLCMTVFYPPAIGKPDYVMPASVVGSNPSVHTAQDYVDAVFKQKFMQDIYEIATAPITIASNIISSAFVKKNFAMLIGASMLIMAGIGGIIMLTIKNKK